MWHAFISEAVLLRPNEPFPKPEAISTSIPMLRGELDRENPHNILFYLNKLSDPQFINWETGVQNWLKSNILPDISLPSYSYSEGETQPGIVGSGPRITISGPMNGDIITSDPLIYAKIVSGSQLIKIELYINNNLAETVTDINGTEFDYLRMIPFGSLSSQNRITIKAFDSSGLSGESSVIIYK
jgi:hypothetical protein